ncbi:hypothetical protein ALC60_13191 [Trachymyrmex zeteki]|uniref:CCHC-type domain-containing protein n=1 Tax=Mycetomoellerius zeteki TaxID=64791 RepID=A0A151WIV7_9HYME|nr:hypothetical protein ALC60_13191 [Trachymyrmex zeteki]
MSANAANRITENPIFAQQNLHSFIPTKVLRTGVIQDIPVKINTESIRSNIEARRYKILDIQRLNRKITKEGQTLPKEVFIFQTRHEVRSYIPRPKICFSCYRIGHIARIYKSDPRCPYCGRKHAENESCPLQGEPERCINCR